MKNLKTYLQDSLKALGIGILASSVAGIVLFICGVIFNHFNILSGLEMAKNSLLLVGAIGIFIIAGMLMVKGKNPEKQDQNNGWKKHFHLMGYKAVIGIICIDILLVASVLDYLIFLNR